MSAILETNSVAIALQKGLKKITFLRLKDKSEHHEVEIVSFNQSTGDTVGKSHEMTFAFNVSDITEFLL